jgi:ubiquinone/menaquinone biosynthesis C-methylase UbiE
MRKFWDARAREDAYYFIDNRLEYGGSDEERFWTGGPHALELMETELGVSVEPNDDVVEIGCGVGRMSRALAARARSVRALDVSPEMVSRARELNEHLENVEFIVGDGRGLAGIKDESADVVHSDVVFQHIPDPSITLSYVREMGRVLRAGGIAMFQVSNVPERHRPEPLFSRTKNKVASALGRRPKGQDHRAWLGSGVELEDVSKAAREGGMTMVRVSGEGTMSCRILLRKGPASA